MLRESLSGGSPFQSHPEPLRLRVMQASIEGVASRAKAAWVALTGEDRWL
jgi:hypothetical protein